MAEALSNKAGLGEMISPSPAVNGINLKLLEIFTFKTKF
jgi:hypothetical protein